MNHLFVVNVFCLDNKYEEDDDDDVVSYVRQLLQRFVMDKHQRLGKRAYRTVS